MLKVGDGIKFKCGDNYCNGDIINIDKEFGWYKIKSDSFPQFLIWKTERALIKVVTICAGILGC
jgi:hypothetical protein